MRIMQRKASNKLSIQDNSLKPEKRLSTKKTCTQNHDSKCLGADLKPKKMKKTRSITTSELKGSPKSLPKGHDRPQPPQKLPPLVSPPSPAKTPSPKKPTLLKSYASPTPSESYFASPNYMKSTSSSEARKEKIKASVSSSSMLQRVPKSLNRSSSLKKVRTLTKAPSFKHTRLGGNKCTKVVFCENHDVQRATCSSTLKDSKFPPYLMLNPGATEAQGTSAMNVCPYNYCSLNGHHHNLVPPLKRFLSSRRRHLKAQRVVTPEEDLSPRKDKFLQKDVKGVYYKDEKICDEAPMKPDIDRRDDFFVKIYVPGVEVDVSHNGDPCSKVNSKYGLGQSEGNISLDGPQTPQSIKVDETASVGLDEFFGDNSDMEWEEGRFSTHFEHQSDVSEHGVDRNDKEEPDLKSDETVSGKLEGFLSDKQLLPYSHEEIVEWMYYSDVSSMADSESSHPGETQIENPNMINKGDGMSTSIEDNATISNEELEVKSTNEQGSALSDDPNCETSEVGTEEFDCYMYPDEENHGDEANIEKETVIDIGESTREGLAMETTENFLEEGKNVKGQSSSEQSLQAVNNCQAQFDSKEANNAGEEDDYPTTYILNSYDDFVSEIKSPGMEDINEAAEDRFPAVGNNTSTKQIKKESYCRKTTDPREELLGNCLKLNRSMRREKEDEEKEEREFNPRAPNFLPIEPDPEAERVDLRHLEMDERRNSEEWMLDYALQRTVNQLAPARKRKVALLVEAFESVLPIPKCEPHVRRTSSGFARSRPIRACS